MTAAMIAVWVGGPEERFRVVVGLFDVTVDGALKIGDGAEDASFQPALGEFGEEAFDGVQP